MTTMDCKEVLANMSCYIDGDGSAELRKALEEHIASCRRCRVVFDTTGQMLKIVTDAEPFEVPLAISARLYNRLQEILSEP
jgi:predicted anti-sigma-YlaC factor YlaD